MNQLSFKLRTWGGKRRLAGRKPKGDKVCFAPGAATISLAPPRSRDAANAAGHRVFAGMEIVPGHPQRHPRSSRALRHPNRALLGAGKSPPLARRSGRSREPLPRHAGLTIRIARAINRAVGRRGKVFADRYHAHILSTRREVANALRYVLENFR